MDDSNNNSPTLSDISNSSNETIKPSSAPTEKNSSLRTEGENQFNKYFKKLDVDQKENSNPKKYIDS